VATKGYIRVTTAAGIMIYTRQSDHHGTRVYSTSTSYGESHFTNLL